MDTETLRVICDLTVKLTDLRQRERTHLVIENFAPELLAKLISTYLAALSAPAAGGE